MKKFNLKKAKEGAELITASGKQVKILLFDRDNARFPIVAIINNREVINCTKDGKYYIDKDSDKDIKLK
jgi:hypothetical protein